MDNLMDTREAAEYLRVHKFTVYKLAQKRKLPAFKVGGSWRFKKDVLDNWLAAQAATNLGNVLVITIDSSIRDVLKEIIKDQHHEVTTAESGEEALKLIKKHHFDVVFTSLVFQGISGNKLLEEIKAADSSVLVVAMIAASHEKGFRKAMSAGPLMVIPMPFNEKDVIQILQILFKPEMK
jgi:excisionase family DNA binding protein